MFFKIGVLKNYIFTGNTCVGVSSCNFSKKRLQHKCFCGYCTKFKSNFFYRTPPMNFIFPYYLINVYFKKYSMTAEKMMGIFDNVEVDILIYSK